MNPRDKMAGLLSQDAAFDDQSGLYDPGNHNIVGRVFDEQKHMRNVMTPQPAQNFTMPTKMHADMAQMPNLYPNKAVSTPPPLNANDLGGDSSALRSMRAVPRHRVHQPME